MLIFINNTIVTIVTNDLSIHNSGDSAYSIQTIGFTALWFFKMPNELSHSHATSRMALDGHSPRKNFVSRKSCLSRK